MNGIWLRPRECSKPSEAILPSKKREPSNERSESLLLIRTLGVVLFIAILSGARTQTEPSSPVVDVTDLTSHPGDFDGKTITVRARLGEWAIYNVFFRDILLVLRAMPESPPELEPVGASHLTELVKRAGQLGLVIATFSGRFEWGGVFCSREAGMCKGPFGQSRTTMRIVLHDVTDVTHFLVPRY